MYNLHRECFIYLLGESGRRVISWISQVSAGENLVIPSMYLLGVFWGDFSEITNIFLARKCIVGGVHKVGIYKIFGHVWASRTTSPHTFTGETRLYTQHFAANRMSGKIRV